MENIQLGPVLTDHHSVPTASCSLVSSFLPFVVTEPCWIKSVCTEECHRGHSWEFLGTVCWTYGQLNAIIENAYTVLGLPPSTGLLDGILTQISAVIMRSSLVRYYINHYRNWGRIWIGRWIHKRHPMPRLWCCLWIFVKKFTVL